MKRTDDLTFEGILPFHIGLMACIDLEPVVALVCGAHAIPIDPFGAAKVGFTAVKALAGNAGDEGVTAQPDIETVLDGATLVAVAAMLPIPDVDRLRAVPIWGV